MVYKEANECEYFTPLTQSKKEELLRLESAGKTPRRVKVYLLEGEDWLDNGTGFCVGEIDEDTRVPYFLVKRESKKNEVILKSNLEGNIQYQRQQDTLIVWTDPSGSDLALSFQETEGCADLCDFIIKVQQGNYSPNISLYYVISRQPECEDITELVTGPIRYPPPSPSEENIETVLDCLNQGAGSQFTRTNISDYLVESKYFEKLLDLFRYAESNGNTTVLHHLSDIVRVLLSYNEPSLLEDMLSSETNILLLSGVFEYESSVSEPKPSYRTFFEHTQFKTVIPTTEQELFKRDHYLTVLKESVLTKYLDDHTVSQLNSMIYENQVKILKHLKSAGVLEQLFEIYDTEGSAELKRDGVKMLHQYILLAKSIQKHDFFASLIKPGLFTMVNFALNETEDSIRIMGTELIVTVIEQSVALTNSGDQEPSIDNSEPPIRSCQEETTPSLPHDVVNDLRRDVSESKSDLSSFGGYFVSTLSEIIANDEHVGLKYQAFEALKTLLDPSVLENAEDGAVDESVGSIVSSQESLDQEDQKRDDKSDNEVSAPLHLASFYKQVAPKLFAKLVAITEYTEYNDPLSHANSTLLSLLCDFIVFGAKEHDTVHVRNFLVEHKVLQGMVKLLDSPCKKVLKLHIVRCLRSVVLLNDDEITNYILENDILESLFQYFATVIKGDNMCSSACLDFLNIIRVQSDAKNFGKRRNFKLIAEYLKKRHGDVLESASCMKIGPDIVGLVENNFNEMENTTLGICGETDLEQLGIHESFIRNGFSCNEDVEDLSLESSVRAQNGSMDSMGVGCKLNEASQIERGINRESTDEEDYRDAKLDSSLSKIGEKRSRDSNQVADVNIHNSTKRRSFAESEQENNFDASNPTADIPTPYLAKSSSGEYVNGETSTSANKTDFETVKGRLVEVSGQGTHDR
ncbi:PSY2 [Candida theae]|uniref:Serine/threonine-protein phosphatase 4 regulatory subunit 3 n=1 Tax=Candida theae TaxID=1198502 RepID=A0AAD5G0J8_9ASCO|nr:PSY2 [Candida theae]KAI5967089.1 PSY2 [Candida theae]